MVSIRWEGPKFSLGSLAHVNREICNLLAKNPEISLSIEPSEQENIPVEWYPYYDDLHQIYRRSLSEVQYHVRHQWPPNFEAPPQGKSVLFQPWEFGYIPSAWVAPIRYEVDEVWVNSQYTRDMYIRSGIPSEKVFCFPLGFDPAVYNPKGDT